MEDYVARPVPSPEPEPTGSARPPASKRRIAAARLRPVGVIKG